MQNVLMFFSDPSHELSMLSALTEIEAPTNKNIKLFERVCAFCFLSVRRSP